MKIDLNCIIITSVIICCCSLIIYNKIQHPPDGWHSYEPLKSPSFDGPLSVNHVLDTMQSLILKTITIVGPETIAFDSKGNIWTGVNDGSILCVDPTSGNILSHVPIGGRPLGLVVDKNDNIIVAESRTGLIKITKDGHVILLSSIANDGKAIMYADDVTISLSTGDIYFSDATRLPPWDIINFHYDPLPHSLLDMLSAAPTGRLLRYSPSQHSGRIAEAEVLLNNLQFANGVVLSQDESFILICETGNYRIKRYWLKGSKAGTSDIFADNLPGFPDGISLRNDGSNHFWVAIFTLREAPLDYIHAYPLLKQIAHAILPVIKHPYTMVLELDEEGNILQSFHGPGKHSITSITEKDGILYLGNLETNAIGIQNINNI